jgi:hypothetical protein
MVGVSPDAPTTVFWALSGARFRKRKLLPQWARRRATTPHHKHMH